MRAIYHGIRLHDTAFRAEALRARPLAAQPRGEVRKGGEAPLRERGEIDPFIEAYLFSKAK